MKILFTRHGESLANTLHIISNRDLPHPLTEQGRAQAAALAKTLARRIESQPDTRLAHIYASPILRARQTAEIVAARLADLESHALPPVELSPGLSEYDCGILEGHGDDDAWSTHNRFFHDWLEDRRREQFPAGGETFNQIRTRLTGFVNGLLEYYGPESATEVLCVSHGGTLRLGLPGLLDNLDFDFVQTHGLGHTDIIETETRAGVLICRSWGQDFF